MSKKYAVAAAACYVTVPGVGSMLLYRDAPVPDSADDLDRLEAEGLIVEIDEENLGGLQTDIPPDLESPSEPLSPVVRDENGDDPDGPGPMPPKSVSRAEWDAWASTPTEQGGGGLTLEEAQSFSSKEALQQHFGVS